MSRGSRGSWNHVHSCEHVEALERRRMLADATTPVMVADIDTTTASAGPAKLFAGSGTLLFVATDGISGFELWKSDGTEAGTVRVKDVNPGGASLSGSTSAIAMNWGALSSSVTIFVANDGVHGLELWRTDGTEAGTQLVKDIRPGSLGSQRGVNPAGGPQQFEFATVIDGIAYFEANDGVNGPELWRTDGTADGTYMVKNTTTVTTPSLASLTAFNGALYFTVETGSGRELWKSDGTDAGTAMLKDIYVAGNADVNSLTVSGGNLFFSANDGSSGAELWKTDGTVAGTVRVKDINVAAGGSSSPTTLTDVAGTLFFVANDGGGIEMWKSDGSEAGTVRVTDLDMKMDTFTAVGSTLFFVGAPSGGPGRELWKSDGTAFGTVQVKDIYPGTNSSNPTSLTAFNGQLYFAASDDTGGNEPWRSNGTEAGTVRVKDIYPGMGVGGTSAGSSSPTNLIVSGGALFFSASEPLMGRELWKSDGSEAGTVRVKDINTVTNSSAPSNVVEINGKKIFTATDAVHGRELYVTDGTAAGTSLLKEIMPGPASGVSGTLQAVALGNYLYFPAFPNPALTQLWRTDGTPDGTTMVKQFVQTTVFQADGGVTRLVRIGDEIVFWANDGVSGHELWKTDGTPEGTVLVKDIRPGSANTQPPFHYARLNDIVLFAIGEPATGTELWKTDGTEAGTVLVKDIYPGTTGSSPTSMFAMEDYVFFTADAPGFSNLLWRSDGTAAGTVIVKDFGAGGSRANSFARLGNKALFALRGELYSSDGTEAGTQLVKEIDPGPQFGNPTGMTTWNGAVYFRATQNLTDSELWRSDGTEAGTYKVKDIAPGPASSIPTNFIATDFAIYFTVTNSAGGTDLWKSDGTEAGTVYVTQVGASSASSRTVNLSKVGTTLFYVPDDGLHGLELWRMGLAPAWLSPDVGASYELSGNTLTISGGSATFTGDASVTHPGLNVVTAAGASVIFDSMQELGTLEISGDASVTAGGNKVLVVNELLMQAGGALDLTDNDLAINYSGASPIGSWNGSSYTGITGMIAAGELFTSLSDSGPGVRRLGVGDDGDRVLVKYTYGGDLDLDGDVDGDDYFWIDANAAQSGIVFGYGVGDIDLDGDIDGDDYFALDQNIAAQGPVL